MKTKLLAVGLLLYCLVVGLGARLQPDRRVWEYRFEYHIATEQANKLGAEGWELVATAREGSNNNPVTYIFKRARN